ncbi:MAG TPA: glycosyltransferase family 39 protein [Thermoanaerobaculia bacterium]|nr:glycosyltransferase family 39 protein [Thermoanaerobaculia bacterium]
MWRLDDQTFLRRNALADRFSGSDRRGRGVEVVRLAAPNHRSSLAALFVGAVAARLIFCFVLFPRYFAASSTVGATYFFDSYREIATSVLSRGEYELETGVAALHRPPGYVPVIMAAVPTRPSSVALFQTYHAILGGLAVFVTYLLARSARASRIAAVAAGATVGFWPFLIWESKVTVPENLLVVLTPLLAFVLLRAGSRRSWRHAALAGLIAGYTALTHALYQVVIPAAAVALVFMVRASWRTRVVLASAFLVPAIGLTASWVIRNSIHSGYSGLATGFGLHYWKGVYAHEVLRSNPRDYFRDHEVESTEYVGRMLRARGIDGIESNDERSDPARNELLDRMAVGHAVANPVYTIEKTVAKIPLAWVQQQSPLRSATTALLVAPLLALAGVAAWLHRRELLPLWLPLLVLNVAAAMIFVEAMPMRYALPWIPLVAALDAVGMDRLVARLRLQPAA